MERSRNLSSDRRVFEAQGQRNTIEGTILSDGDAVSSKANDRKKMLLNRWMDTSGTISPVTAERDGTQPEIAEISGFKTQHLPSETPQEKSKHQKLSAVHLAADSDNPHISAEQPLDGTTDSLCDVLAPGNTPVDYERNRTAEGGTSPSKPNSNSTRKHLLEDEHPEKSSQKDGQNHINEWDQLGDLEELFGDYYSPMNARQIEFEFCMDSNPVPVQQEESSAEVIVIDSSDEDEEKAISISSGDESCSEDLAVAEQSFAMPHGKARFITERTREFSPQTCSWKGIKCVLSAENNQSVIRIHGTEKVVKYACTDMKKLIAGLFETKHTVKDSGIGNYYKSREWKKFLAITERMNNCIILMPSETALENAQFSMQSSQSVATNASTKSNSAAGQNPSDAPASTIPLSVHLIQGDIGLQQADVIVNPILPTQVNNPLDHGSAVSRALSARAGPSLMTQCSMLTPPFRVGDVLETDAGCLPCRKVYHAIISTFDPSKSKSIIQNVVCRSLFMADNAGFTTIAFPAIATGGYGHPPPLVAQWMREIISRCAGNSLQTVIIVLHPSNSIAVAAFHNEFSIFTMSQFPRFFNVKPSPASFLQQLQQGVPSSISFGTNSRSAAPSSCIRTRGLEDCFSTSENEQDDSLDFYLYSISQENIVKAIKSIMDEIDKTVLTQVVTDDALEQVTDWEISDIKEVMKRNKVRICFDKSTKELALRGLTKDVMQTNEEVKNILKELTTGEAFRSYVSWEKRTKMGYWEELPVRSTYTLEKAFKARAKNPLDPKLCSVQFADFQSDSGSVAKTTFNLSSLETDPNGTFLPYIRRKVRHKEETDIPANWTPMHRDELFKKEELGSMSPEFIEVKLKFDLSNPRYDRIIKIERIQNPFLYRQYKVRKDTVGMYFHHNDYFIRELFHGTSCSKVDKICASGFDRNFAGENGTAFGKGVYFAVNSSYSIGYAGTGIKCIFLVEVITGVFTQGRADFKAPPEKPNTKMLCDSVVDNVQNPRIFVVFRDSSAYPLYLITFC